MFINFSDCDSIFSWDGWLSEFSNFDLRVFITSNILEFPITKFPVKSNGSYYPLRLMVVVILALCPSGFCDFQHVKSPEVVNILTRVPFGILAFRTSEISNKCCSIFLWSDHLLCESSTMETACCWLMFPLTLSFHCSISTIDNSPEVIFRSNVSCPLWDFIGFE
jgi:hypothetical protein